MDFINMKLLIFLCACFSFCKTNAQVGINTQLPTRKLDVNGNARIEALTNKSDNASYDRILVTDNDGNIDYATKESLLPSSNPNNSDKESYSQIYNQTVSNGDPTKVLKCGKFYFSFSNASDSQIGFRLIDNPGKAISIYMTMEQNWDGNGFQLFQGKGSNDAATVPFVFNSSNYNVVQIFAEGRVADFEQNVMHFQYPGDNDFYRLIIYKVLQKTGANNWDFAAVCEKF